ncbi:MAG: rhomboid family intramembrane serine protease [Candidatus Hydrogenedentes bacterium]|nr:rhomboid family intramembrane serine protease [Candidatus Hydrogenedentota bacterium]
MRYYYSHFYHRESSLFNFSITQGVRFLILLNFTIFILQLCAGVFITAILGVMNIAHFQPFLPANTLMGLVLGFYIPNFLKGMIWEPITYQFLHSGLSHLFFNMLWLFVFGPDVELYFGRKRFYVFYLFCGALAVLSNLFPYVLTGHHNPVIGASGSVMSVLMAFAYLNPEREFFLFPFPIPINAKGIVLMVVILNLLYSLGESNYSVLTHLCGLGCGYIFVSLEYNGYLYKIWNKLGI